MLLPKRIWRDIPGYEGKYQVSNTGQVRSLNYNGTGKKQILKGGTTIHGYKQVILYKDGKHKRYSVHRLVAQAFIPNPNNLPQVNHKDENKTNNVAWNLEWISPKDNCNYGTRNKRRSEAMKGQKRTKAAKRKMSKAKKGKGKPVLMFTLDGQFIRRFDCVADANEYLGKGRYNANIYLCAGGINNTAHGFIFKYEEDCK